jgi:hypothetical protein
LYLGLCAERWGVAIKKGKIKIKGKERERERERESGGMMKGGRDKAGNLSGRFSLGQEMHSYMAQKSSTAAAHTCIYIYT